MGLRFKKSIKIAPGVKLNLNKKSVGVTVGKKGAHYTVNSKGKKTASVGIPGTGLSYSTSSGGNTSSNGKDSSSNPTGNNNKNGGCGTCLLWLLGICLILAIFAYAWIPGVIGMIYFSKKITDPSEKKKTLCVLGVVTILSFLLFLSTLGTPELTNLSATWTQQEFDINDTTEVKLEFTPSDAKIETLTISESDIADLDYTDGIATISFKKVGTASIAFIANGSVTSNSTTITVIDKEAEEQKAKEEAERKAAEEEAKKLAEEEARLKAEEEAKLKEEQEEQQQTATQEPQEEMVWIPSSGSKYHSNSSCSNMNNPRQVTLSEAQSMGYTPCKNVIKTKSPCTRAEVVQGTTE